MPINSEIWPVQYNPLADATFTTTGIGQLSISIPGGVAHNIFTGNLDYAGLFQNVISGTDFNIVVKVDSVVNIPITLVAIICKQDDNNLFRFSVQCSYNASGNTQRIFTSKILAGTSTTITNTILGGFFTAPFYIRLVKTGNNYSFSAKQNAGDSWVEHSTYADTTDTFAINQYGLAVGNGTFNGLTDNAPAFTGLFDYFTVDTSTVNITSSAARNLATSTGNIKAKVSITSQAVRASAETVYSEGYVTVNPIVVVVPPTAPGTVNLPYGNKITIDSTKSLEFNEQKAQYGDGKEQTAPNGLHPTIDVWTITWGALTLAEKASLETTLSAQGTWGIYAWIPCNETVIKYFRVVNKSVKIKSEGPNGVYSISADLKQDFSVS